MNLLPLDKKAVMFTVPKKVLDFIQGKGEPFSERKVNVNGKWLYKVYYR